MPVNIRPSASTSTSVEEVLEGSKSPNALIDVPMASNEKARHFMDETSFSPGSTTSLQSPKSFSCFINSNSQQLWWRTPIKFFHIAARELSVLLILIETLILLGGYLIILGVHHSIKYCLNKLRYKTQPNENVVYMQARNYYNPRPVIARRVPRGRMAGG